MKLKDDLKWQAPQNESSQVAEAAHDDEGLYIRFHSGGVYGYPNVPVEKFHELLIAESAGKFLNANIKPNFSFERLN